MIDRKIYANIMSKLRDNKAIIILGPRQVGKTTLLKKIEQTSEVKTLWWNGDEPDIRELLKNATSTSLKNMIGSSGLVFY